MRKKSRKLKPNKSQKRKIRFKNNKKSRKLKLQVNRAKQRMKLKNKYKKRSWLNNMEINLNKNRICRRIMNNKYLEMNKTNNNK